MYMFEQKRSFVLFSFSQPEHGRTHENVVGHEKYSNEPICKGAFGKKGHVGLSL